MPRPRQALRPDFLRWHPAQEAAVTRCAERVEDRLMAWCWAPAPRHLADGLAGPGPRRGVLDNGGGVWRGDVAASSGAWAAYQADGRGNSPW